MLHRITTQIGQTTADNGTTCRQVLDYLAAANIADSTCTVWDGALLAWAAIKDGIVPPIDSGDPKSWLTWGTPLDTPIPGAVAILTSGSGRHRMMCAIVARVQGPKVYVIGSFDGVVQSRAIPLDRVIAVRRPPGAALPLQIAAPDSTPQPIVIQHALAPFQIGPPPVVAETAPMEAAVPPDPPVPSNPASPAAAPAVSIEALQRLLTAVQDEFATIHSRIDMVSATAVGAITIDSKD